jgi:hypothetical protein
VGRGQEALDEHLVRVGRGVGHEPIHLLDRGRQAREVEAQPPDEGDLVGFGRGLEPLLLQPGQDEAVDRVASQLAPRPAHGGDSRRNAQWISVSVADAAR